MKGKRYTTEDKVRILREADSGKSIQQVCREHNLSEVSFHRWKRQFGQMEISEARRLKELERENSELKKMLAESLLKNRVLEAVCAKNSKPGASAGAGAESRGGGDVLRAGGVSDSPTATIHVLVSRATADHGPRTIMPAVAGTLRATSSVWLPQNGRAASPGRLAGGQAADSAAASCGGTAGAADQA